MAFSAAFTRKYEIKQVLGEGGMSRVYLARDLDLSRLVAIKFLQVSGGVAEGLSERLSEEARVCAAIKHPNVVRVYDQGVEAGNPYVVFEFVEGYTLLAELKAHGALPLDRVGALFYHVLLGLEAAHDLAIVHRDLKPGNIILRSPSGEPKLMDFGVAKAGAGRTVTTQAGMLLGTPAYMAPEIILGEEITRAADVYSMGVMLYECLAGESPFIANTEVQLLSMHVHTAPVPLVERVPGIPQAVSNVVARALAKRPEERYPDARAMRRALEDAMGGSLSGSATKLARPLPPPVSAVPPALEPPPPPPSGAVSHGAKTAPLTKPDVRPPTRAGLGAGTRALSRAPLSVVDEDALRAAARRRARVRAGLFVLIPLGLAAGAVAWLMDRGAHDVRIDADDDGRIAVRWTTRHAARGGIAVLPRAVSGTPITTADAAEAREHAAHVDGLAPGPYGVAVLSHDGQPLWSDTVTVPAHGAAHAAPLAGGQWEVTAPAGTADAGTMVVPGTDGEAAPVRSSGIRANALWFRCAFPADGPPPGTRVRVEERAGVRAIYRVDRARDLAADLASALGPLQPDRIAADIARLRVYDHEADLRWAGAASPETRVTDALRERLVRERVWPAMEALAPLADRFFAADEDALQLQLYGRLVELERLQALVIGQHEVVKDPLRRLYASLVKIQHGQPLLVPPDRLEGAIALVPASRLWVPADLEAREGLAGARDARGAPLSSYVSFAPELEELRAARKLEVRAVVSGLAAGTFLRVHFACEGPGLFVLLSQPGRLEWYRAMDATPPLFGEIRAELPTRFLPRGQLKVETALEHVPGVKLSDVMPRPRAALIREVSVRAVR